MSIQNVNQRACQTTTHQPAPDALHPVPRRRLVVGIRLNLLQACHEVHVLVLDKRRAEVYLRANIEDGEEDEWQIVRHEGICLPVALEEHRPARELS